MSAQLGQAHSHAFGRPALHDLFATVFFVGRRRASCEALIDAAGVVHAKRVLDVGCGTGYFARLLAKAVGSQGTVIGVDPDLSSVRYAAQEAARWENCSFQFGDVTRLPHLEAAVEEAGFAEIRPGRTPALLQHVVATKPRAERGGARDE